MILPALAGCTEAEQKAGDSVLASFGVTTTVTEPITPQPPPRPECYPVFRVIACGPNGERIEL